MKILVFSDSHGKTAAMTHAMKVHQDAETVIFLGDGLGDFFSAVPLTVAKLAVRGNCDWEPQFSHFQKLNLVVLCDKRIVYTHGHEQNVKYGEQGLQRLAENTNADLVLFGHTHLPTERYENGVYYFNPGTIGGIYTGKSTYGIITLTDGGILLSHGEI